jgi:hypothetical protein
MSNLPEIISLGPMDEADRLWSGAEDAFDKAGQSLVSLCECLDLGIRAVEILVVQRMQSVKEEFPGTISLQLETPAPAVDAYRDAVTVPKALQFTEILDLLSVDDLSCVGPRLHRGWEDRRFSCLRSRATARRATGVMLGKDSRDKLLLLSAYRNRIMRYPPPVRIVLAEILGAFGELRGLVERLRQPVGRT